MTTGQSKVCACGTPDLYWKNTPCNETGWHCLECKLPIKGEPPGFSPKLDKMRIDLKVSAALIELHTFELIYISNSDAGDAIEAAVVNRCKRARRYDQWSVIFFIMDEITNPNHAKFWQKLGAAIRKGEDPRRRCHCGALATCFGSETTCSAHMKGPF